MEVYRLVNELDLDWIFNCINRVKIYNMVRGSVTHTQTTLEINNKRSYRPGERQKFRAQVKGARLAISMVSYG